MCCFTGKVDSVADTNIFARVGPQGRQVLVYSMTLGARATVAMVLPIPVKAGSDDKAVQFFDFSTDQHVHRCRMKGRFDNRDVTAKAGQPA